MTMINVDTSPLQAAREWRGMGLVAAALASGLPVAQAEALESGDPDAFDTIDEMIASAVVYGASLGIGRDEAMALLDRTVSRHGVDVELPDASDERPGSGFSSAVRERSARMGAGATMTHVEPMRIEPLAPSASGTSSASLMQAVDSALPVALELDGIEVADDEPAMPADIATALPTVPSHGTLPTAAAPVPADADAEFIGPSPEQAMAASSEIHMGHAFDEAPWDRSGGDFTGELEAWAADADDDAPRATDHRRRRASALVARAGAGAYTALERVLGTERADAVADASDRVVVRVGDVTRSARELMRRSEHATLIVAIGGGAVLIALVVAIGGALGDDTASPNPATQRTPKVAPVAGVASPTAATAKPKPTAVIKPKPVLAPTMLHVDVYNAGHKKGYAKQIAAQLQAAHYRVGKVTNAGGRYAGATVIYPKGLQREAKQLAQRVGVTTTQVSPASGRSLILVVS